MPPPLMCRCFRFRNEELPCPCLWSACLVAAAFIPCARGGWRAGLNASAFCEGRADVLQWFEGKGRLGHAVAFRFTFYEVGYGLWGWVGRARSRAMRRVVAHATAGPAPTCSPAPQGSPARCLCAQQWQAPELAVCRCLGASRLRSVVSWGRPALVRVRMAGPDPPPSGFPASPGFLNLSLRP